MSTLFWARAGMKAPTPTVVGFISFGFNLALGVEPSAYVWQGVVCELQDCNMEFGSRKRWSSWLFDGSSWERITTCVHVHRHVFGVKGTAAPRRLNPAETIRPEEVPWL